MLVLLSPAKKLDEKSQITTDKFSSPEFMDDTSALADGLKNYSPEELSELMHLSENLGNLNYERYQKFNAPFTLENSRPAIFTFKGTVYDNMGIADYDSKDLEFAQEHLRILSGFYGLLKPLDLMQPYRLEMGTKYKNSRGKNLYDFWGDSLTNSVNEQADNAIINLASIEYFKAIKAKKLKAPLINIVFKQLKNEELKTIGIMAKRARGLMADFIIKNKITNPEKIKEFSATGYSFVTNMSSANDWVFIMDMDISVS